MSEETSVYTGTLKASGGYDAPWLVVRADTIQEFGEALADARAEILQDLAETADLFATAYRVVKGLNAPETTAAVENSQQAAQQSVQAGTGKFCPHGQRVQRAGTSSRGAWTGYFCPLPKGSPDQCKPEFA